MTNRLKALLFIAVTQVVRRSSDGVVAARGPTNCFTDEECERLGQDLRLSTNGQHANVELTDWSSFHPFGSLVEELADPRPVQHELGFAFRTCRMVENILHAPTIAILSNMAVRVVSHDGTLELDREFTAWTWSRAIDEREPKGCVIPSYYLNYPLQIQFEGLRGFLDGVMVLRSIESGSNVASVTAHILTTEFESPQPSMQARIPSRTGSKSRLVGHLALTGPGSGRYPIRERKQ